MVAGWVTCLDGDGRELLPSLQHVPHGEDVLDVGALLAVHAQLATGHHTDDHSSVKRGHTLIIIIVNMVTHALPLSALLSLMRQREKAALGE
jgi:hypothetical protein